MTDLGTLGFPAAADEDYVLRLVADLRRAQRELGPSIAKSFAGTVTTLQETVDAVGEAQQALDAVVTKLAGLRTYATPSWDLDLTRPSGEAGAAQAWASTSVDLEGVVVPPQCALLVTVSCSDAYITFNTTPTPGGAAVSQLSFDVEGWDGVLRGNAVNTAFLRAFSQGSYSSMSVALSRTYRIQPPPGTYKIRGWGGGYHSSDLPATRHQFFGVTLVAQVIPASGF